MRNKLLEVKNKRASDSNPLFMPDKMPSVLRNPLWLTTQMLNFIDLERPVAEPEPFTAREKEVRREPMI